MLKVVLQAERKIMSDGKLHLQKEIKSTGNGAYVGGYKCHFCLI